MDYFVAALALVSSVVFVISSFRYLGKNATETDLLVVIASMLLSTVFPVFYLLATAL